MPLCVRLRSVDRDDTSAHKNIFTIGGFLCQMRRLVCPKFWQRLGDCISCELTDNPLQVWRDWWRRLKKRVGERGAQINALWKLAPDQKVTSENTTRILRLPDIGTRTGEDEWGTWSRKSRLRSLLISQRNWCKYCTGCTQVSLWSTLSALKKKMKKIVSDLTPL